MNVKATIEAACRKGRDPYVEVACELDRCEPSEVSIERREEVKRFIYRLFYGGMLQVERGNT